MIGRICLLLEALSIVICLHHLYGEKFRLEIKTIGFLAIDMIIMTAINYFNWPRIFTMIIYPILFIYCGLRFGFKIKKMIVNNILCIIIVGVFQIGASVLCYYIFRVELINDIKLIIVNGIVLVMVILLCNIVQLKRIFVYMQAKGKIIFITIILMVVITTVCLISFKGLYEMHVKQYIIMLLFVGFICILAAQIGKYKIHAKEIEIELKMHELYAESFKELIDNVRMRQHEFDNHLNTIYSMHLLSNSYEELVEMQRSQCKEIEKDNRYNKLLKNDNQIIRGFLYTNFLKAEKKELRCRMNSH